MIEILEHQHPVLYRGNIWALIAYFFGKPVIKDIYNDEEIVVEVNEIEII